MKHMGLFIFVLLAALVCSGEAGSTILVVRERGEAFEEVLDGFREEIGTTHVLQDHVLSREFTYERFERTVRSLQPALLLLMDARALDYAKRYRRTLGDEQTMVPSVVAMTLNLDALLEGHGDFCGIAYEIPVFSIATRYQDIQKLPVETILALYRDETHQREIENSRRMLARVGITLIAHDVDRKARSERAINRYVARRLGSLIRRHQPDAVWVISDNKLVNPATLRTAWLPAAREFPVPFLAGISHFASDEADFCVFALSPDHYDLGAQSAQMALNILEQQAQPGELGVEYAISVKETINSGKLQSIQEAHR